MGYVEGGYKPRSVILIRGNLFCVYFRERKLVGERANGMKLERGG